MTHSKSSKFHPLYFPICQRCHGCQQPKINSTMQIVASDRQNRQRYFCCDCAIKQGQLPAKELLGRIEAMEKPTHSPSQRKSTKAKARATR